MGKRMKHLWISLCLSMSLFATQLHWYDDYNEALRVAKKEHKPVYIFITSAQCQWCHKFEKTTLQDEAIRKRLKKEFITVHLVRDFDDIPKQFKTSPVPRHYFTDPDGKIIYSSLGHRKVECFDSFMSNAQDRLKTSK
jgi:protein disulfide-isomerase